MYGLVLEGGGARGSFQIGAWKALKELEIDIGGISGTSVGALNGAMMIQDDFECCYDLWYNIDPLKVMNVEDKLLTKLKNLDITPDNIHFIMQQLRIVLGGKGIDVTPLKELLNEIVKEEVIRKSPMDFGIVTISLSDRKPMELFIEDIPQGQLANYLLASANLPVFKFERIDGKLFLDGGFYDNMPIRLLASKGYKEIIAVKLYDFAIRRRVKDEGVNITYINPSEDLGMTLDFTKERSRKNLKLGYYDTLRVFKDLKGEKYYIDPSKDSHYFFEYLMGWDEELVLEIGKILGMEDIPYRRMLFEHIIPKLGELLNIDKYQNYEEVIIALYERAAERLEIERFNIYSYDDFIDEIITKFKPARGRISKRIPRILKQSDLLLKTVKKDILDEILDVIIERIKSN